MPRGNVVARICQAFAWTCLLCFGNETAATEPRLEPTTQSPGGDSTGLPPKVLDQIRSKLADQDLRSDADPADVAALADFYGNNSVTPLWITDMGLSARGQSALFEIEK